VSRISVGGILGFIKSKFTPTLKRSDTIDNFWQHRETGRIIQVKNYRIVVGDVEGKQVIFFDPGSKHEVSMWEKEFRSKYRSRGNKLPRS
jgi:hypothetical protein